MIMAFMEGSTGKSIFCKVCDVTAKETSIFPQTIVLWTDEIKLEIMQSTMFVKAKYGISPQTPHAHFSSMVVQGWRFEHVLSPQVQGISWSLWQPWTLCRQIIRSSVQQINGYTGCSGLYMREKLQAEDLGWKSLRLDGWMEEFPGWTCGSNKPQTGLLAQNRPTPGVWMAKAPEWMSGTYLRQDSWMEEVQEWMVE